MIPPEPESKTYTYLASTEYAIGDTTGTLYTKLNEGDNACGLSVSINGNTVNLTNIVVNYVPAFDQYNYYFCDALMTACVLASNASVGGTHPYYSYNATSHTMVQSANSATVLASVPTDYFDTIKSGNFELQQRS